ncbi:hypothetical protein C8F04DRAFT_1177965 [Mycena alexandri]|uniref:3'-5' exonuclease domain-containing protein n=1 Tax=Mycena alexandri TaxID=1745969 RepID=A0AAD6X6B3_9AGAR|nr:hypothetical protein C8F04DRAFT_1177965 [Mycena alexandri]
MIRPNDPTVGDESSLPVDPPNFTVHYLTTESAVNSALGPIIDGVVGFDTEFVKRLPTREERIIDEVIDLVGGSRKSAVLCWQMIELRTYSPFPYAWDTMGLCLVQIARGDTVWVINLREVRVVWNDLRTELQCLVDCGMMARLLVCEQFPDAPYSNMSMEDCAVRFLGFRVDKGEQVSNWNASLSENQIRYAATDAVVALRLYERLDAELNLKAAQISRDIPFGWYSFDSRMGEATRIKRSIRSESVPWSSKDYDCVFKCFKHFLGDSRVNFAKFAHGRNVVCSVHRHWRLLLQSVPAFWAHVVLSQHISAFTLERWLTHFGTLELHVEVVFRDLAAYYDEDDPSSRILAFSCLTFPVLLASSARWSSFAADIEDPSCGAFLLRALRQLHGPLVRLFSMNCPLPIDDTLLVPSGNDLASTFPFGIFPYGGGPLTSLSLKQVLIGWRGLGCLRDVVDLELVDVRSAGPEDFDNFVSALNSAICLEHLVLCLLGEIPVVHRRVHLPVLVGLEACFNGSVGLGAFVGGLEMPLLSRLVLELDVEDMSALDACLLRSESVFSAVSSLSVRSTRQGSGMHLLRRFYEAFPSITSIDLLQADYGVFAVLSELTVADEKMNFPRGVLLPRLRDLSLRGSALDGLSGFVDARAYTVGAAITSLTLCFSHAAEEARASARDDWNHLLLNVRTRIL